MNKEESNPKTADPIDIDVANVSQALNLEKVVAQNEQHCQRSKHVEIG